MYAAAIIFSVFRTQHKLAPGPQVSRAIKNKDLLLLRPAESVVGKATVRGPASEG